MSTGPDRLGRYVLSGELGRGGMGTVHAALDEGLGREVALKVIAPQLSRDPDFVRRFLREARIAATIEHPNVVPVYEAGEVDGTLFIAMQRIRGVSLEHAIEKDGPLEPARVARIARQLGRALDCVHSRGLVHRDVKPANVLLTGSGEDEHAYLADFGLARDAASATAMTQSGQWIGTLDFIAPEILEGAEPGPASDIYSMACLIYTALRGEVPFPGAMARKLAGHAGETLPSVGDGAIDQALRHASAKDPAQRPSTATDFARKLEAAIAGKPLPSAVSQPAPAPAPTPPTLTSDQPDPRQTTHDQIRPDTTPKTPPPPPPRKPRSADSGRRVLFAAIAMLVIAAGAATAWALTRDEGGKGSSSTRATTTGGTTAVASAFKKDAGRIASTVQPGLDDLAAAARSTDASSQASLGVLRESAESALSDLGGALVELRALDVADPDRSEAAALERALEAHAELARALAARRIKTTEVEPLAAAAARASGNLTATVLPEIEVDDLIAGLKAARKPNDGDGDPDVPENPPPALELREGEGFEALLPTGSGWSEPVASEPNPGRIYRTTVRGPDGEIVLVDYTPDDPAVFGKDYSSRRTVDHPVFGSATEYVFTGSKIPECDTSRCIDFIMNDRSTGSGFAVLGGGGDRAISVARRVMESLVPR